MLVLLILSVSLTDTYRVTHIAFHIGRSGRDCSVRYGDIISTFL